MKAAEWAAARVALDAQPHEFKIDNEMVAWIDDSDGALYVRHSIPLAEMPRFLAWLNEWYGEQKAGGDA